MTDDAIRLLTVWGRWSRDTAESLGYPSSSSIATMIEQTKVFAQPRGNLRKTAVCSQTRVMIAPQVQEVPDEVAVVDRLVARADKMYQKCLKRRYIFNQPDRFAARDLRMDREVYTAYAQAAEKYIADRI